MERLVGDTVDRCLSTWLTGTYSAQFNALAIAADGDTTEITCQLPPGEIGTGSLIAIDDELMYVAERDATNSRLIVVRGVHGTTQAEHAVSTPIEINPRFPRFMVRQMMIEEIDSWSPKLYQAKTYTADLIASAGTIAIAGTIDDLTTFGVLRVRRGSLSFLDSRLRRTNGYEVEGDFNGDGGTIMLTDDVGITTSFSVTVACGFNTDPIDDFGDDADLLADVGLSAGMVEIVELGAAYRLLIGRASIRLFPEAQGQSRIAQEVGSQDIPAFALRMRQLRDEASKQQIENLYARWGFGGQ